MTITMIVPTTIAAQSGSGSFFGPPRSILMNGVPRGIRILMKVTRAWVGESHLEHVCGVYEAWYNLHRPHSSLDNKVIAMGEMPPTESTSETARVVCERWLGSVLRHYRRAAA